jgi:NADH dehydrogenase (ubiquinone) Fe-S protein 4
MGWTSSADPLENMARTSLVFFTKEEALAFCTKQGWKFAVDEPNEKRFARQKRYSTYSDNFSVKRKGTPDLSTMRSNR